MALVYVGPLNTPNYTALATDIGTNKITGAVRPGNTIFLTDTAAWKIVMDDLTLADYAIPATFSGSISLGAVTVGTAYAMVDGVGNYSLIVESEAGGDVGSASLSNLPYAFNGATWDRERTPKVFKDVSAVTITGITTVWTPAGGKKFRLMGGSLSSTTAISILFEDNAGGNFILRTPKLLVDTPYTFSLGNGILSGVADRVLKATGSGAGVITGFLYGTEE
jgi:hypothetical protein